MKHLRIALLTTIAALAFAPALAHATGTPINNLTSATGAANFDNGDYQQEWTWNTLYGYGLFLSSDSTDSPTALLGVELTGTNSASGQSSDGIVINNLHTGTNSTNYGLYSLATDGTTNNFGVEGVTSGTNAGDAGVWGAATGSGATYGVYGTNISATGYAGYFDNSGGGYAAAFMGGNVGIGTTLPGGTLSVNGGVTIGSYGGNDTGAPSNGMIVSGDVGIGTTSPYGVLHTVSSYGNGNSCSPESASCPAPAGSGYGIIFDNDYTTGQYRTRLMTIDRDGGVPLYVQESQGTANSFSNVARFGYDNSDSNVFAVFGGTYLSGNVGIGTTSPAYLLQVGSSSASGVVMELKNSSGACTYNPGASSVTVSCSSDKSLKSDIEDAESALPWLDGMRIRDFTIKATGERKTGVIAQEMLPSHPDMVHVNAEGLYSVDEPNPWMMVKAIQELKADNDDLRVQWANDQVTIQSLQVQLINDEATLAAMKAKLGM
jgi:hypothetical protein